MIASASGCVSRPFPSLPPLMSLRSWCGRRGTYIALEVYAYSTSPLVDGTRRREETGRASTVREKDGTKIGGKKKKRTLKEMLPQVTRSPSSLGVSPLAMGSIPAGPHDEGIYMPYYLMSPFNILFMGVLYAHQSRWVFFFFFAFFLSFFFSQRENHTQVRREGKKEETEK